MNFVIGNDVQTTKHSITLIILTENGTPSSSYSRHPLVRGHEEQPWPREEAAAQPSTEMRAQIWQKDAPETQYKTTSVPKRCDENLSVMIQQQADDAQVTES